MEKKSLPWNLLQANAILERMHQVLQDCLVTFQLENVDIPEEGDKSLIRPFCRIPSYLMQSTEYNALPMLQTGILLVD